MFKQKKTTLLRRVLLILAAVFLGWNIYKWNAQSLMGNRLPMPLGIGLATVLSGSMEPTLQVNDLVVIRETDDLQEGDIIVYQSKDSLVIHRVQEINGDSIIAKGDANNAPDDPIRKSDVKGVLLAAIPGVGIAVQFVRQPAVALLILAAAVTLTELSFRKEKEKDQKELDQIQAEIRQLLAEIKEET